MKIIDQSVEIMTFPANPLYLIELAGRTCYKSESKGNPENFVGKIMRKGHESVIEHASASVRIITDRAVSHELVRHRLASYSQESQRYVRYSGEIEFIRPYWWHDADDGSREVWETTMELSELSYKNLIRNGISPEGARAVLPNSTKTEIIITANFREWRHIFRLRCSSAAYPQMRLLMQSCRKEFRSLCPVIFDNFD